MNDAPLQTLVFVLDTPSDPDVVEAVEELRAQDLEVRIGTQIPDGPAPGTLYLTDAPARYAAMTAAGLPTIGYLPAGHTGEDFSHCPYLISEPQWVDADSYRKIYERILGLPWTILTTDRLVIREMTVEDLDDLYALYDEEACRFMTPLDPDRDVERARLQEYIDKVYGLFGYGYWALTLRDSGRLIGRMGFAVYDGDENGDAFGYVIHPDYRRHGYAREAATAILPYARKVLGLARIRAEVHPDNLPSIQLLHRLGFCKVQDQECLEVYVL